MEKDYHKEFEDVYTHAVALWEPWWNEAKTDLKYYLGDQWNTKDKLYLEGQRRNALVFNKIRRVVHLLTGYQRKNRLSLIIGPTEGSDEETASQLSGIVQWHMSFKNGYNVLSDAFEQGPIKTGFNMIRLFVDYGQDPINGDIGFRRIPFNKFIIDPHFTERDFQDANFVLFREYLTKEELKPIFPNHEKDLDKMSPQGSDQKYPYALVQKDMFGNDKFRYDEFWRRNTREVKIILDPETGAQKIWPGDEKRIKDFLEFFPKIKVLKKHIKTVELLIFVDNELFYKGPDPGGLDDFPLIPLIGFYDPEYDEMKLKLQGLVRCMRDPQTEVNKRRSKFLDMMDNQIASGWAFEENALVDPSMAYQTGQGQPIVFKQGKIYGQHLMKIEPVDIPEGFFRFNEMMDKDIMDIPGANAELFGMPENEDIQIAGILAKMRQSSGLTILQDLFDNFRLSQKIMGQRIVQMIQENYLPEKVQRILNQQPSKEFYTKNFGKYDCVPTEGVLTDTQKQTYFMHLLQLRAMQAPIPWTAILDAAPIEQKGQLKAAIAAEEKSASEAQKAQMMMQMLTQAMMQAKTASDIANAEEKRAQAKENLANMWLDRVKTMKELSSLQTHDLIDLVSFAKALEQPTQTETKPSAEPKKKQPRISKR
jgi:hypothetical protein